MSPNQLEINKLIFNFVSLCEVRPISCWRVKPRLARPTGGSLNVDEAVDDSFKPWWVQIDQKLTNLCSIVFLGQIRPRSCQRVKPRLACLTGDSNEAYEAVDNFFKSG